MLWRSVLRYCCKSISSMGGWQSRLGSHAKYFSNDAQIESVSDIASLVRSGNVKQIAVMAGAGISTASGIPDFRTPGTGLYDNLQKYNLPYPEAIFDIGYFSAGPEAFFALAQELYPSGLYRPNICHYFVRLLEQKGLLCRMYTQNIDGLERLAGIQPDKIVEAHGTFATATCRSCGKIYKGEDLKSDILDGKVPHCKHKSCHGVIKPDIVFFGEQLPERFYLFETDMLKADLLIVMGTSLEVYPFAGIAEAPLPHVPRLLFNMTPAGTFVDDPRKNDVTVTGDIVRSLEEFCTSLGWTEEINQIMDSHEQKYCIEK